MRHRKSTYKRQEREFYATPEWVTMAALQQFVFRSNILEPACGDGAIVRVLQRLGYKVNCSDIEPVGVPKAKRCDFVKDKCPFATIGDIFTNPPFGESGEIARAFIERALELTRPHSGRVTMLLSSDYDSGISRKHLFDHPAFSERLILRKRIKWFESETNQKNKNPSSNHTWYHWDWAQQNSQPTVSYYP